MDNKIVLTNGAVYDAASIISCTFTESCNSETDICPGAICSAEAQIELRAQYGTITQGTQFTLFAVDTEGNETQLGVFTAEKPERVSSVSYRVIAYDNISLTYTDASAWLRENQSRFPMTMQELVQAGMQQCGLTMNGDLPNGELLVQAFYADDMTWNQIFAWAGQAACRFVRADAQGRIEFGWYKETRAGQITESVYLADKLQFEDYHTASLDKVQIRQSANDVGVIYPPEEAGTNAYVIQGNMLLAPTSADALTPVAEYIYKSLKELRSYTPGEVSVLPALTYRAGDIVTVAPQNGEPLTLYLTEVEISASAARLTCTGNARRDSVSAVNQKQYSNLQGKMLEIKADVDGLNIKASDLEGNFSQLQQTVDGLSLTVSKTSDRDLFGDAAWSSHAASAVVDGKSVTLTTSSAGSARSTLGVPAGNLEEIGEGTFVVSVDYRITAEVNTGSDASGIAFWMDYPGGNVSQWVKVIYSGNGSAAPVQDWQTAQIEVTGKAQPPTRVYLYAYLNAGTGAVELRDPVMYQKTAGSSISLTSDGIVIGTASDIVQVDGLRDAFAQSDHSVTINSGTITFAANTLVVDSDNFQLTQGGDVSITGTFHATDGTSRVDVQDGLLRIWRKLNDNTWREAATLASSGSNAAIGNLYLLGPGATGGQVWNMTAFSGYAGGDFAIYNAAQEAKFQVYINGNGEAEVWVNGVKRF